MKGILKGCKISNCDLVGGETAEMPGTYEKGKFDIAGFAVGLVEKKILNKKKIKINDLIVSYSFKWTSFKWIFISKKYYFKKKIKLIKIIF